MAIASGSVIDDADIAARYTWYSINAAANGGSGTLTLPSNSGYIFFTYDTLGHIVYGAGNAYFADSTTGWIIKGIGGIPSTIVITIDKSNGKLTFKNNTTQAGVMFVMWVGANT